MSALKRCARQKGIPFIVAIVPGQWLATQLVEKKPEKKEGKKNTEQQVEDTNGTIAGGTSTGRSKTTAIRASGHVAPLPPPSSRGRVTRGDIWCSGKTDIRKGGNECPTCYVPCPATRCVFQLCCVWAKSAPTARELTFPWKNKYGATLLSLSTSLNTAEQNTS